MPDQEIKLVMGELTGVDFHAIEESKRNVLKARKGTRKGEEWKLCLWRVSGNRLCSN